MRGIACTALDEDGRGDCDAKAAAELARDIKQRHCLAHIGAIDAIEADDLQREYGMAKEEANAEQ